MFILSGPSSEAVELLLFLTQARSSWRPGSAEPSNKCSKEGPCIIAGLRNVLTGKAALVRAVNSFRILWSSMCSCHWCLGDWCCHSWGLAWLHPLP